MQYPEKIEKRDGRVVAFNDERIERAVLRSALGVGYDEKYSRKVASFVAEKVVAAISSDSRTPTVEHVQDVVEETLMRTGSADIAKAYILYRHKRTEIREQKTHIMRTMFDLTFKDAQESDSQRENANVDADSSMGTMLKYGSEVAKQFYLSSLIRKEYADAHRSGRIHIHDMDFYALTTTCTQIDLARLFRGGFFTGHGFIREPNSIGAYASLACIAIQANQNDQHGGQSLPMFEYNLAPGVAKSFRAEFLQFGEFAGIVTEENREMVRGLFSAAIDAGESVLTEGFRTRLRLLLPGAAAADFDKVYETAYAKTVRATYQAMEALIHNLNTMSSRAGAQVPFSSINYGTGTSPEQRMVIRQCLLALDAGLGNGETSIFPIHVFKTKEGVNLNPGDPNYDLFQLACRVSARRLFPNFTFLDAPFNLQYYREGDPDTEVATMGCRTRVMGNVHAPDRETTSGRGNLSFTSVNLPRLAIEAKGDTEAFMTALDDVISLVFGQLMERFEVQAERHVYNYPFLMGQGVWMGSERLSATDTVREVLKDGTLTIGFIGLAEALKALFGKHHGESAEAQEFGLKVVRHMRQRADAESQRTGMNFTVIATPAEGLSGRFVRMDRKRFGVIKGVTDREYYTNSFHVPVYFPIGVFEKIRLEGPYHALCNGGHITYVELDGDVSKNPEAFEQIIRYMREQGIGYGSINHAVDYDPVCGYTGIINDVCPRCGRREGEGISAERLAELKKKFQRI
ncbi:MAG: anaerobic ribonucleoside triphosphate reductase [Desulfovibrionaceae bacterium]|nr:anaerobic ribonucleoside triphosphate reductase [Desulfovibrionaceae bacterium]